MRQGGKQTWPFEGVPDGTTFPTRSRSRGSPKNSRQAAKSPDVLLITGPLKSASRERSWP